VKRLLWIGVGVAVTVVVLHQVSRLNNRVNGVTAVMTPAGIAASIGSLAENVSTLGTQLRESMAQNEEALRNALLPDEETLARARESRAAHRARRTPATAGETHEIFPDDGTDYF
jgi:ABC-type transporter Mla subunit MlaD